jgi:septal ring factor EnvC (AmiA/AmiB activator)
LREPERIGAMNWLRMSGWTRWGRGAVIGAVVACLGPAAAAQQDPTITAAERTRAEYEDLTRQMSVSQQRAAELTQQVDTVDKDQASITAALIQAAKTENKLAQDIEVIAQRLEQFRGQEDGIRSSLAARRDTLAEVLGALQRMGLNPPPAILVTPEDALASVRSAILLGAVVPELREQTDILVADLAELSRVTSTIEAERGRLAAKVNEQVEEKKRLELLIEAKNRLREETQAELAAEQKRAEELAARAGSLVELIEQLDAEAAKTRAAAEKARAAAAAREREDAELAALPENSRSLASLPFGALQQQLPLPAAGRFARRFGDRDDNGGVMHGDTVATQSGAIVTAPADGQVLYAGPFRSYGQLLILDAGDGYHIVLAGLTRISVALGQAVLAGEPVGAMGESRVASTSARGVTSGAELYVEFRKNGKPVDPSPWWAERLSGRT